MFNANAVERAASYTKAGSGDIRGKQRSWACPSRRSAQNEAR